MRETEIHIRMDEDEVEKFKKELVNRRFKDHGVKTLHEMIFNEDCFKEGVKIRIRVEDDRAQFTCKSKTNFGSGFQDRKEVNIDFKKEDVEKYITMLEMLGYKVFYQILKKRHIFTKDGIEVVFDKWPLIGELVEVEGKEDVIKEFVNQVIPNADTTSLTYKEHLQITMKTTGKSLEELKREYEQENDFELINIEKILES